MNYLQERAEQIRKALPSDAIPEDGEALLLMYAVLARSKGLTTTAEDVHDAWTAWMMMRGHEHDSMRPFEELAQDVQAEDLPFLQAIHAAARSDH
jgi:hypothetical protein